MPTNTSVSSRAAPRRAEAERKRSVRHWPYTGAMTAPALARSLREFFEADAHGAAAVYLFGSAARGTAGADSDVDIGLLLANPPPPTLDGQSFDVADALERALGRRVDVVLLNTA